MTADSPLYRLISVVSTPPQVSLQDVNDHTNQRILANHLAFVRRNPSRVMSVPVLPVPEPLDNHLPLSGRAVQSTGNLFSYTGTELNIAESGTSAPVAHLHRSEREVPVVVSVPRAIEEAPESNAADAVQQPSSVS
ncbi:hypothetical protein HDU91_007321, partial [Kappamyces sp. JEL0680]